LKKINFVKCGAMLNLIAFFVKTKKVFNVPVHRDIVIFDKESSSDLKNNPIKISINDIKYILLNY